MKASEIIRRLRIELEVRTRLCLLPFPRVVGTAARAAFHSGYEVGWRGKQMENPYTRKDCREAFDLGTRAGAHEAEHEIKTKLRGDVIDWKFLRED
jgi:hypothetical protein